MTSFHPQRQNDSYKKPVHECSAIAALDRYESLNNDPNCSSELRAAIEMRSPTPLALCVSLTLAGPAFAQKKAHTSCDLLKAKAPDIAHLLNITKAQRDEFKQFIVNHEADLKACLSNRLDRLKAFLK